jgi:hypothetical protein
VLSRVSTSPRDIEIQFERSRAIEIGRQHDSRRVELPLYGKER